MRVMLLLAVFACGELHAEGGCPDGMIPHRGNATSSCGPIPDGYYADQGDRSGARWEKRWGTIATDPGAPSLGFSTGFASKRSAEKAALLDCRAKGGTKCTVELSYSNQCAALVVGEKRVSAAHGPTVDDAVSLGTQTCEQNTVGCRVFYTDCSYAERVRRSLRPDLACSAATAAAARPTRSTRTWPTCRWRCQR